MKRTAIKRVSSKHAVEQRERAAMLRRTTHGPVRCCWPGGCVREAVDNDERLSRAHGGSITDVANLQPFCREHHDWKHAHPDAARAMGLTASRTPADTRTVSDSPGLASNRRPSAGTDQ